eukprot:3136726-Rhodomonas_salina.5
MVRWSGGSICTFHVGARMQVLRHGHADGGSGQAGAGGAGLADDQEREGARPSFPLCSDSKSIVDVELSSKSTRTREHRVAAVGLSYEMTCLGPSSYGRWLNCLGSKASVTLCGSAGVRLQLGRRSAARLQHPSRAGQHHAQQGPHAQDLRLRRGQVDRQRETPHCNLQGLAVRSGALIR